MPAARSTIVLSDAHLVGTSDPAQQALVAALDHWELDHLVLAGDLFDVWWGGWGMVPRGAVPVCAALLRVRARGARVTVVPGNRDFLPGPFFQDDLSATIVPEVILTGGGRRWSVTHGDQADRTLGYRMARRVLRSRPFGAAVTALGPRRGGAFLRRLAGTSRDRMAPAAPLVRAQRTWAEHRVRRGDVSAVALGHSHTLGVHNVAGGVVVHLGDWAEQRSYLALTPTSATLWAGGHATPIPPP